jgi:hypothetical protein
MNRFQLLLVGTTILGLAGCGEPKASAPEAPAAQAASASKKSASGFTTLQGVADKTAAAVKADKFDQAQSEFKKFEASWKTVEDGVKTKSSATYGKIEDSMDALNDEFKQKQPGKTKILATLESLSKDLKVAVKP